MSKLKIPKSIFNLDKLIKAGIKSGLQRSSIEIAGIPNTTSGGVIKSQMNEPKTGFTYPVVVKKRKKYLNHTASNNLGTESSAVLSGQLAKSIRGKTLGTDRLEISANTPYAGIQEYGGKRSDGNYWLDSPSSKKKRGFGLISGRQNLKRGIMTSRGNIINNIKQGIDGLKK